MADKVNIGCGTTPTEGWQNFDNSPSLRIAKIPFLGTMLGKLGVIDGNQADFITFAREQGIQYADGTKTIPLRSNSISILYSSHMLEHLDRNAANRFLTEAIRVLQPAGWIRISVPDLAILIDHYQRSGEANEFLDRAMMCIPNPSNLIQKLKLLLSGPRHHLWMYDEKSLSELLKNHGFVNISRVQPGTTNIPETGSLNLHERQSESLYIEGQKPGG